MGKKNFGELVDPLFSTNRWQVSELGHATLKMRSRALASGERSNSPGYSDKFTLNYPASILLFYSFRLILLKNMFQMVKLTTV